MQQLPDSGVVEISPLFSEIHRVDRSSGEVSQSTVSQKEAILITGSRQEPHPQR